MADGNIEIKIGASTNALNSAVAKAKKQLQDLTKNADKDSDSIAKAMDDAVKDIEKAFDGLSDVDLSKIKEALQDSVTEGENTAKAFDEVTNSAQALETQQTSLRVRLKEIQQAMADMQLAGKDDTAEFQALAMEAGRLRDAIGDAQTRISALANDNQGIQALSGAMSGLAGAGSAATGAVSLLGDESDDLQKVMVKLQSVMAITNGLQAVANTLNKDSATSIYAQVNGSKLLQTIKASAYPVQQAENKAIEENTVATKANNVAKGQGVTSTVASTTATTANTTATTVATTAQFSLAGAIKGVGLAIKSALGPFGLIATAIGGVVAIIMKLTSESRKAEKEMEEMRKATAEFASAPISQLDALRAEFADTKDQEKWFNVNKARIQELAPEIQTLTEAQELFNKTAEFNSAKTAEGNLQTLEKRAEDAKKALLEIPEDELKAYEKETEEIAKLRSQGFTVQPKNRENASWYKEINDVVKADADAQAKLLAGRKTYNQAINNLGLQEIANRRAENEKMIALEKERMDAEANLYDAQIKNMSGRQAEEAQLQSDQNKKLTEIWSQRQDLLKRQSEGENVDSLLESLNKQEEAELAWFDAQRAEIEKKYTDVLDQTLSEFDRRRAEAEKAYKDSTADLNKQASQDSYSSENSGYYTNQQIQLSRDYAKELADITRDEKAQEIALWKETEEAKIVQMQDTTQKQIAGYQLAHEERLKQIDAEKQALQEQNAGDASATIVEDGLTQEQLDSQNAQRIQADEEYKASLVSMFSDLETQYGTFYDQLLAKQQEYNSKAQAIEFAHQEGAINDEQQNSLMQSEGTQEGLGLAELARQAAEASAEYDATAQEILQATMENLQTVSDELYKQIEDLRRADPTNPNLPKLEASYASVQKEMTKTSNESQKLDNAQKKSNWDKTTKSLSKCGSELSSLGSQFDGLAGDIISIAGQIFTSTSSIISSITGITLGAEGEMTATAEASATAIKAVESASVVLAVIDAAMQVAQGIINLFKSDKESVQDIVDAYNAYADAISECIDRKTELMKTQVGDDVLKTYEELVKYNEQLEESSRNTLDKYMSTRESGHHSVGYKINNKMDDTAWNQLASNLGTTVQEAQDLVGGGYFSNLSDLSVETLKIIRDTPAVWAAFDETTQSTIENIIDSEDGLYDATNALVESVTGLTFEGLADNFKDTFQDMTATAEDFSQNFKDIMWQSISGQVIGGEEYQEWLKDWQTRLEEATLAGDDSELEKLYEEAMDMATELDEKQNELLDKYSYLQDDLEDDASTLSGALSSASQESIDLLAGQTNACRINQMTEIDIMNESLELMQTLTSQLNMADAMSYDVMQSQLEELILIREATSTMAQFAEPMHNYLSSIDKSCADIADGDDLRAWGTTSF